MLGQKTSANSRIFVMPEDGWQCAFSGKKGLTTPGFDKSRARYRPPSRRTSAPGDPRICLCGIVLLEGHRSYWGWPALRSHAIPGGSMGVVGVNINNKIISSAI